MVHTTPPDPDRDPFSCRGFLADETQLVREGPDFAYDLVASLDTATRAAMDLMGLHALAPGADITVSARTSVVCAGTTPADALQAAADFTRATANRLTPSSLTLTRTSGPVEGLGEWRAVMIVTAAPAAPAGGVRR
ncbi:hypothetical protein [Streptomyces jumonjinensis]|uniref:hypothetical protein n=1 Tax=Streptomyces jumonjinensis TaxID=1945 RepID=UPI00379D2A34